MFSNHSLRNSIEEYFKYIINGQRKAIQDAVQHHKSINMIKNKDLQRTIDSLMQTSVLVNADMSAEAALRQIVNEAKQLIGAEVASVFLVDQENKQLFSTINSIGGEIRIPLSAGVAGHVATSGEAVNIDDAYQDDRFNKLVDKETGFLTRNILCCPIKSKKGIVGVAQLINKIQGGALQGVVEDYHTVDSNEAIPLTSCQMDNGKNFTSNDIKFLSVFASQAASAIANAGGSFEPVKKGGPRLYINVVEENPQLISKTQHSAEESKDTPNLFTSYKTVSDDEEQDDNFNHPPEPLEPPPGYTPPATADDDEEKDVFNHHPLEQVGRYQDYESDENAIMMSDEEITKMKSLLKDASNTFITDVLELEKVTHGKPLSKLACYLFKINKFYEKFNIDVMIFQNFIIEIEKGYGAANNPYHNKAHAASVLHLTHALMKQGHIAKIVGAGNHFNRDIKDRCNVDLEANDDDDDGSVSSVSKDDVVEQKGDFEMFACLIAAMVHDYDHPGVNNNFLVKSFSDRSLRYNDKNVNEQHHVAAAFSLMLKPEFNFLSHFTQSEFVIFRQLIIDLVISTDMAEGNGIVNKFNSYLEQYKSHRDEVLENLKEQDQEQDSVCTSLSNSIASSAMLYGYDDDYGNSSSSSSSCRYFKPKTKDEAVVSLQLVLKASDLGHLALPWDDHLTWVKELEKEFFIQGDKEKELGFHSISFLMDRNKPGVTQTQIGFFDFVVYPLFNSLYDAFKMTFPMKKMVDDNYLKWKMLDTKPNTPKSSSPKNVSNLKHDDDDKKKMVDEVTDNVEIASSPSSSLATSRVSSRNI